MGKVLIEILLIVMCTSIAFVLGTLVSSGARRNKKEEKLLKENVKHVFYLVSK